MHLEKVLNIWAWWGRNWWAWESSAMSQLCFESIYRAVCRNFMKSWGYHMICTDSLRNKISLWDTSSVFICKTTHIPRSTALAAYWVHLRLMDVSVRVRVWLFPNRLMIVGFLAVTTKRCEENEASGRDAIRSAVYWFTETDEVFADKSCQQHVHAALWDRKESIIPRTMNDILRRLEGCEIIGFDVSVVEKNEGYAFLLKDRSSVIPWNERPCQAKGMNLHCQGQFMIHGYSKWYSYL